MVAASNAPFMYIIIMIAVFFILKGFDSSVDATSAITVTSTNPVGENNYFYSPEIMGNFSMSNCSTSNTQKTVGYLQTASASSQEIAAITQINSIISDSFTQNNPEKPVMAFK